MANAPVARTDYQVFDLPCGKIFLDHSFNCRRPFTPDSVKDLAADIKTNGLEYPITVQPRDDVLRIPEEFDWRVVVGHRRLYSIREILKWPMAPCFLKKGLTDKRARVLNLKENILRNELNIVEEGVAITQMFEGEKLFHIARELNKDQKWVRTRLIIARLPPEVQDYVAAKRISQVEVYDYFLHPRSEEETIEIARKLATKYRKRGRRPRGLKDEMPRRFRRIRSKLEINDLIEYMQTTGGRPCPMRVAAWCAGSVSDEEIQSEILNSTAATIK